jgi:predicted RNA binding protein YcfA (HicA-like mRNA interferase family)
VPKFPVVSGKELIKYLTKYKGFEAIRRSGSHVFLKKLSDPKISTTVPLHDELKLGTLRSALLKAGISDETFIEEWKRYM